MGGFDNVLTIFILLTLFVIIYLKVTDKTPVEFYREIMDIIAERREEAALPIEQ